jgi:hypothetical protein
MVMHNHSASLFVQYLLTASLDGTIKIWSPGSSSVEVVNPQPDFKWPEEEGGSGGGRGYRQVGTTRP